MAKISLYTQAQAVLLDDVQDSVVISSEARILALAGGCWSLNSSVLAELHWILVFLLHLSDKPEALSLPLAKLQRHLYQMNPSTPGILLRDAWPMRILPWLQNPALGKYKEDLLRLYRGLEGWFEASH